MATSLLRSVARLAQRPSPSCFYLPTQHLQTLPLNQLWSPEKPVVTHPYSKGGAQAWITRLWTQERLGLMELDPSVFCVRPRFDIIREVCRWKRECDKHGAQSSMRRCDLGITGKKMWANSGTGRARHSNAAAPQFRKARNTDAWGLKPYDRSFNVPLKVRRLAMRSALSVRYAQDSLFIVDALSIAQVNSNKIDLMLKSFGWKKVLFVREDPSWKSYLNEHYVDVYQRDWDDFMKAANKVQNVKCVTMSEMTTFEVTNHTTIVLTVPVARALEEQLHWV
ncbi:large ribosomal subunit protein uL4-like [Sycon ciliatum]|uniref:large ribosomal subunit protein uL4-like n=1 Tax=Sycon ciliatum TaxID=27933 RepID=UPI0031F6E1C9